MSLECNCRPLTNSSRCNIAQIPGAPIYSADFPPHVAEVARKELEAQRERGEWSGLVDASGGPVYTLAEIAAAVRR